MKLIGNGKYSIGERVKVYPFTTVIEDIRIKTKSKIGVRKIQYKVYGYGYKYWVDENFLEPISLKEKIKKWLYDKFK